MGEQCKRLHKVLRGWMQKDGFDDEQITKDLKGLTLVENVKLNDYYQLYKLHSVDPLEQACKILFECLHYEREHNVTTWQVTEGTAGDRTQLHAVHKWRLHIETQAIQDKRKRKADRKSARKDRKSARKAKKEAERQAAAAASHEKEMMEFNSSFREFQASMQDENDEAGQAPRSEDPRKSWRISERQGLEPVQENESDDFRAKMAEDMKRQVND